MTPGLRPVRLSDAEIAKAAKDNPGKPVGPEVMARLKTAAAQALKDPGSAQWDRVLRARRPNVRGEPADVVCGYVNAKNAMGGYVGFKPFVYVYGQLHAMAGDEINNFVTSAMLKNLCRGMI